jgi:hypothetical protein
MASGSAGQTLLDRARSSLPVSRLAACAALLAVLSFAGAFALGRATAADEAAGAAAPRIVPVPVAHGGVALPGLSEAEAVPELAPPVRKAKPVVRRVRPAPAPRPRRRAQPARRAAPRPVARPKPAPRPARKPAPKPAPKPVVIVGSG